MLKSEKKKERKERKIKARGQGRWLSNVSMSDARRINRLYPKVSEGTPKPTADSTIEDLCKLNIVGLYGDKSEEIN